MATKLGVYRQKRRFDVTPEPAGGTVRGRNPRRTLQFVVQKHDASRLHYDFRLEFGGVLKSWSVPKGPSLDPAVKRLAVEVEDHPVEYGTFEGTIPHGQYGGGTVMLWDRGTLTAEGGDAALEEGYRNGKIDFILKGRRLAGAFTLVRTRLHGAKPQWLLIKRSDAHARPGEETARDDDTSVATGRTMDEIAGRSRVKPARKTVTRERRAPRAVAARSAVVHAPVRGRAGETLIAQLERIERSSGGGELVFDDGRTLEVTHLDKKYFPDKGYTKGDVMRYYVRVAGEILPLLRDRPLALKRYPDGVTGPSFFQHAPQNPPECVRTQKVRIEDGSSPLRIVGGDLPTLLYTVQLGAISAHPWHSRVDSLDHADYLVMDLDPERGVPYARVVEVARYVHEALGEIGMHGAPKTSGSSGMHVIVPLPAKTTYARALGLADRIAEEVARAHPDVATVERRIDARPPGTVYVDAQQNARGKTVASAFAVRVTPGARVSMPLRWKDLAPDLDPGAFTLATVPKRLPAARKAWRDGMDEPNRLPPARRARRRSG